MSSLFDADDRFDAMSTHSLTVTAISSKETMPSRARSVTALGRRASQDAAIIATLETVATDPIYKEARMFELVSLAYLAMAALLHAGTQQSLRAAQDAFDSFTADDKGSLIRFLNTGGLPVSVLGPASFTHVMRIGTEDRNDADEG